MKIAYVADHRGLGNDDEGAITYAFEQLGHTVLKIQERRSYVAANHCDFALVHHHWRNVDRISDIRIPKVFWGFDLIHHPKIPNRSTAHFRQLTSLVDVGFCSDGYWAAQDDKIHHLFQGADERCMEFYAGRRTSHLLFAGSLEHQVGRKEQHAHVANYYGELFKSLHRKNQWVYRGRFAKIIAKTKIVLSLESPTKDDYWSNRVFIVAGFRESQIHPYCSQLNDYYIDGEEIVMYHSLQDMFDKIDYYLEQPEERERIARNAFERTKAEHTYRHRCQRLLATVEGIL